MRAALIFCLPFVVHSLSPSDGLRDALARASPGDVISLDPGVYSGDANCNLVLNTPNVELRGPNAILACPLNIRSSGCVVNGVGFRHMSGCLVITGANTVVRGATFLNCTTPTNGGAINILAPTGLTVLDSIMVSQSSAVSNGGAVYAVGSVNITSSVFRNNSAGVSGGAVWLRAGTSFVGGSSVFQYNQAVTYGGAIFMQNFWLRLLDDVVCDSNTAMSFGGCVTTTLANLTISNRVKVLRNTAGNGGGGLYNAGTGYFLVVEDQVVISQNHALSGGGLITRNLIMRGAVLVSENSANFGSGMQFLIRATISITGRCVLRGNSGFKLVYTDFTEVSLGGAMAVSLYSSARVGDTVVIESNSADCGGGVYVGTGSTIQFDGDVVIRNNTSQQGGGLHAVSSVVSGIFANAVFAGRARIRDNLALDSGGGIWAAMGSIVVAESAEISDNAAINDGGGIFALQSTVVIKDGAAVRRNTAQNRGGGISLTSALLNEAFYAATQCTISAVIESNSVLGQGTSGDGGGLASEDSQLVITDGAVFYNNTARWSGGGLLVLGVGSTASIGGNAVFRANSAETGGAILVSAGQLTTSCCVMVSGNRARADGGALESSDSSVVLLKSMAIVGNTADQRGGGVFAAGTSRVELSGCAVSGNRAALGGGLLASVTALLNVTGATIVGGNTATNGGGGYAADSATILVGSASVLINNTATADGGGIYSLATMVVDATSAVTGCSATRGGGLFLNGAAALVQGRVEANHASSLGGGVFMFGPMQLSGPVRGNAALSSGGGIFASGADARLSLVADVVVENNTAGSGGGLYLEEAAAMVAPKELCPCSGRGNGLCDVECLTRACNWDDGECAAQLSAPPDTCSRDQCSLEVQQVSDLSGGCFGPCFSASCDWSRWLCVAQKSALATCPLFDLATYASPTTTRFAIGTGGARKCRTTECDRSVDIVPGPALDTAVQWVFVPNSTELESIRSATTLEVRVRGWAPGAALLSTPNVDLVMAPNMLRLRLNNCTELWPMSAPSGWFRLAVTITNASTGVFVDGVPAQMSGMPCPLQSVLAGNTIDVARFVLYSNSLVEQRGLAVGRLMDGPQASVGVLIGGLRIWDRVPASGACADAILCHEFGNVSVVLDRSAGDATNGYVLPAQSLQCTLADEGGPGWCVGPRPDLPSLGLAYENAAMQALERRAAPMDFVGLQGLFPGCAKAPVTFRNNRAIKGSGGAVYEAGCNSGLDGHGVCFFSGMSLDSGSAIVVFEGNYAKVSGGAVYTDCDVLLPTCTKLMTTVRLGVPGAYGRNYFRANAAGGYGSDVATAPSRLVMPNRSATAYVPGQDSVDLTLQLLDGLGTVVNGDGLPYVITMLLCQTADCSLSNALRTPTFFALDVNQVRTTGTTLVCPDRSDVYAFFYLTGTTATRLQQTLRLQCLPCRAGQERVQTTNIWRCDSCLATQYIVDPNHNACRKCPSGAKCDGSGLVGLDGSGWQILGDLYRIVSCPAGYIVIRDNSSDCVSVAGVECKTGPEFDHCFRCPGSPAPGRFSFLGAAYPGPLVSITEDLVSTSQCRPCPRGANCELGGNSVVPTPGYWSPGRSRRDDNTDPTMYKCLPDLCTGGDQCLEGHTGFVCGVCLDNYTHSGSKCVLCGSEDSLITGRIVGLVFATLAFLAAWYFVSIQPFIDFLFPKPPKEATEEESIFERLTALLKASQLPIFMGILKILLTFYQVTSCFWTAFDVPWPESLGGFFRGSTVTKGDVFTIPTFACLSRDWSRSDRLLFYTVTPPAITVLLGLPFAAARLIRREATAEYTALKAKFINATLVFLFLVYPMCSIAILDIYNCSRIESMYWLANDLRLACPMFAKPGFLFVWTVICTALFPLGIPLLMVWGLYYFQVPQMAREKTEREALNAMLAKFQDDHKQDILDATGVDVSFCALILNAIDRRTTDVWQYFSRRGAVNLEVFTDVLVDMHRELLLQYEEAQLREDAAAIFAHFDSDHSGELTLKEFAKLTCALVESWHEDLTPGQIDALVHHHWGKIEPAPRLRTLLPTQQIPPRTKLLRHCAYLQQEQILSVGKTYWNESPDAPERERLAVDCMGFLFLSYRVEFWYFELIEQLRKLLMTSVIVVFYPGSLTQLIGGIFVTFLGLVLCFVARPYMQPQLSDLQAACLSVQGVTLLYGIILIAESASTAQSAPSTIVTELILAVNVGMALVPVLQFFVLRPPPFGEKALWERLADAVVGSKEEEQAPTPRRRRSSIASIVAPTVLAYYTPDEVLTGAA